MASTFKGKKLPQAFQTLSVSMTLYLYVIHYKYMKNEHTSSLIKAIIMHLHILHQTLISTVPWIVTLLSTMYINDLTKYLNDSSARLYADDIAIFMSSTGYIDLILGLEIEG